jgi:hypothetical protein
MVGLPVTMFSGSGVLESPVHEITNSKHQITNKSQNPISNNQNRFVIWNFGHCYLFDLCDLRFGVSSYSSSLWHVGKTIEAPCGAGQSRVLWARIVHSGLVWHILCCTGKILDS